MSNPFSKRRRIEAGDVINREVLDFDFAKVCLQTLSSINVYCCLVCGKYFEGRSESSPAYNHAISSNHQKYLSFETEKFYLLPEGKEIPSQQDVIDYLNPRYTQRDIELLPRISFDLHTKKYLVGYVGLNNIKNNDYANVVVQVLAHIEPIRNHYLLMADNTNSDSLNGHLALLIRKMWSPHLFKSHIAPHEFMNSVIDTSKKRFTLEKGHPKLFLVWLLNGVDGPYECLRGEIEITTTPVVPHEGSEKVEFVSLDTKTTQLKFWFLSVDVPLQVEEVSLVELMRKYDGESTTQGKQEIRTYKIVEYPKFMVVVLEGGSAVVKFGEEMDLNGKKYELLCSVKKNKKSGGWGVSLRTQTGGWVLIEDLQVKEQSSELLFLDNNYILVWRLSNE